MSKPTYVFEYYIYNTYQFTGTYRQLAEYTGESIRKFHKMKKLKPGDKLDPEKGSCHLVMVDKIHAQAKVYAFYKRERLVADGTLREIGEKLGMSARRVAWYKTPSALKKKLSTVLVPLDEEDDQ